MRFMTVRALAYCLFLLGGSVMVLTGDSVISAAAAADVSAADRQMEEGLKAYQRGAFEDATVSWTEAARMYEQAGKRSEQSEALVRLSQAYQGLGHYTKALESLQSASALVEQTDDRL